MKLTNQKPVVVSPVYQARIKDDYDPSEFVRQTVAAPLFTPFTPNVPVSITNNAGKPITEDDIVANVMACCTNVMDPTMETWCKTLYGQALCYFDKGTHLGMQELFPIQSAAAAKLPAPSPTVVYAPASDVIPVCREFLAGQCDYDKYLATMAFYTRANTLAFSFANDACFQAFKAYLANQLATLGPVMAAATNQLFQDFQANINLTGLTESLILRKTDDENNEEYSFARVIVSLLMQYATQVSQSEMCVLPFNLAELYCPRTIVFVNVEQHAHATAKQVADEWAIINNSLNAPITMVSNKRLTSLTASARNLKKIASAAANALSNAGKGYGRAAVMKFMKKPPSAATIIKWVKRISSKMAIVAKSENSYKSVKMSFARPNRRDPDDFNKQGKMVSTKYRPDIHIYLDTSGSISEENYQDAIMACIRLAKTLNVNLYFNSFSHVMSQCTRLSLKGKSLRQIWARFQRVPKVDGGTDYEQIWHYINKSKVRRRELSLILTDFEWTARPAFVPHPKNLYYAPVSHVDWDDLVGSARDFAQSMLHNDPAIRRHILL